MVAALSPADINYDETLSTLRCVPGEAPPPAGAAGSLQEPLWGTSHLGS